MPIHTNSLTTVSTSLFYCCKNVFTHMDDWEKLDETSSSDKEDFYSNLNMKDVTHVDYTHVKKGLLRFWDEKLGWTS